VERFNNGSDVCGFRSLNNSTSKRVLNLLEPVKLTVWKVMIEKVTVVKFKFCVCGTIASVQTINFSFTSTFEAARLCFSGMPYSRQNWRRTTNE